MQFIYGPHRRPYVVGISGYTISETYSEVLEHSCSHISRRMFAIHPLIAILSSSSVRDWRL